MRYLKVKVGILSGHSGKQLLLYLKDDFDCRPEQKYLSYMEYSQRHLLHQDNQYVSAQVDGSVKQLFHNFLLVGLVHIDNDVNIGFIVGCKLGYLSADTIGGYYRY